MAAARAKAPTLAWLLTALACLLAGMAIVEGRHQAVALPHPAGTRAPADVVVTGEVADPPAGTPAPTPPTFGQGEALTLSSASLSDVGLVPLSTGLAVLRVARLTVPPGGRPPAEVAWGTTVLTVETGTLSVLMDGGVYVGQGFDAAQTDTALAPGERLVIAPGMRYAVRNDGPAPAVALEVAIAPFETLSPVVGSGEWP